MYVHHTHTVCASLTPVRPTYSPRAAFLSSVEPFPPRCLPHRPYRRPYTFMGATLMPSAP